MVKVNCDASVFDNGQVGLGVVARDSKGAVLFAACRRVRCYWEPIIAEGKAVAMACRLARRYGLKNVIFESDNLSIVSRLTKAAIHLTELDSILEDILTISASFDYVSWLHCKRDANFVAHHLARLVPFGVEQVWENHSPCEISPYVLLDTLSLN